MPAGVDTTTVQPRANDMWVRLYTLDRRWCGVTVAARGHGGEIRNYVNDRWVLVMHCLF